MDSKEQPLVAIGMPTRNREQYLPEAIDSLLNQTYRNIVLIISDNASTDGTQKMCEAYAAKDKRVRYIRQKENIGQCPNATFVINKITEAADFCMMAEDDNILDKRFVELCMERLSTEPDAAMAFAKFVAMYWDDRSTVERDPKLFFPFDKDKYTRLKKFIFDYSLDGRASMMYSLWRKKIIVGERFIVRYEDDVSFVFRCLSRGYFIYVDEGPLLFKGHTRELDIVTGKPLTTKRFFVGVFHRLQRAKTEFSNMVFTLRIKDLPLSQRIKLVLWNLLEVGRLFTVRKT